MSGKLSFKTRGKPYEYTRLGAQVQNVKQGKVFVFGDGDVCEDEVVEFEMDSMRSRKGQSSKSNRRDEGPAYVERQITEDDTLQSLSLQYGLPISELKRVNNLIRDQDFYALTRVKIPVKQHSFLVDRIQLDDEQIREKQKSQTNHTSLPNGATFIESSDEGIHNYESDPDHSADLSDPETQKSVIRNISISCGSRTQSREAQKFLQNMDKDLSNIMKNTRTERNSLDEVISVLTNKSVQPLGYADNTKKQASTPWLTWKVLVIIILILLLLPIFFLIYYSSFKDKNE